MKHSLLFYIGYAMILAPVCRTVMLAVDDPEFSPGTVWFVVGYLGLAFVLLTF